MIKQTQIVGECFQLLQVSQFKFKNQVAQVTS